MNNLEKIERVREGLKRVGERWPYMDDYSETSNINADIDSMKLAIEHLTDIVEEIMLDKRE